MSIFKSNKTLPIVVATLIALIGAVLLRNNYFRPNSIIQSSRSEVKLVSALEFDQLAENPQAFIIDVHTPEQSHIPGTDAFIPFDQIQQNLDKLPEDKDTPILVYCRSGGMSSGASEELMELGYSNVYDLAGGVSAYREAHTVVEITPPVQDLGTVVYGDIPTREFTLTNFTPSPLKVTRVSASCSCTTAEVEKKELEPYESTTVTVFFNPAIHGDDTDLGELTRVIYIDTDNHNFEQVTAQIKANVVRKESL